MNQQQDLFQASDTTTNVATYLFGGVAMVFYIVIIIVAIVAIWRLFEKAGEAGWKSLIPFYNQYTLFRIAGYNGWMFLLLLIPIVNIVVAIMLSLKLGERFGKSGVWSFFLLFLLSIIGYLILGFGDAQYDGAKHA